MRGRLAVAIVVTLGSSVGLWLLGRLRSDGGAPRQGPGPESQLRSIPAPALRRVLEEDARWLRRRRPPLPEEPGGRVARVEVGPPDPPLRDVRGAPAETRLDDAPLVPVGHPHVTREDER